ncbi:MAG: hypothetical protein ACJA2Z_000217 [Candidatus Paceibacteria bacterium]|jgi:hypothetical protein
MNPDLQKLIEENQELIRENLEMTKQNQKKIKKIQSNIRMTMIAKWLYWILIIGLTVGAFYYSKPYINNAIDTYDALKENVDRSTQVISEPGSLFENFNIVQKLIGS